jgi:hypothetical protein
MTQWSVFLASYVKQHPKKDYRTCQKEASVEYRKLQNSKPKTRKQRGKGEDEPQRIESEVPDPPLAPPEPSAPKKAKKDAISDAIVTEKKSTGSFSIENIALPSYIKDFIRHEANTRIKSVGVCRRPINKMGKFLIDIVSKGTVPKNMKKLGYDDLFHLYVVIELEDGYKYKLEKNHRIGVSKYKPEKSDCLEPQNTLSKNITVSSLFEGARNDANGWEKLIGYLPENRMCQTFVMNVLRGSGLATKEYSKFVQQNTKEVLKDSKITRDLIGLTISTYGIVSGLFYN